MIEGIKRIAESRLFSLLGCYVVLRQTESSDVAGLIQKLRPQDCGIDLIRVGGSADGGYLIPDDLEGIEYLVSPGVGLLAEFENQMADRGIRSFLADYSVDKPLVERPEFTFDKKYLGPRDDERFFTLATWKDKYLKNYGGDLILQMDIEGWEYEVILSTPDSLLDQFRIIVVEFHDLEKLFEPLDYHLFSSCFEKLLRMFHVVHLHPNNFCGCFRRGDIAIPRVMEFTFLNKKRVRETKPQTVFPHKLDMKNHPRGNLPLPKCWYS